MWASLAFGKKRTIKPSLISPLRKRYGAVIVKNDEVIATGYVGAPRGRKNCTDINRCIREEMKIPRGERYELCRSVHA